VTLDEFGDIDNNLTLLYTTQSASDVRMSRKKLLGLVYERRNKMPCAIT